MPSPDPNRPVRFAPGRPGTIVLASLVLTAISIAASFLWLDLISDRAELMNPNSEFARTWKKYREDFHYRDMLVVVVEGTPEAGGTGAPAALARRRMKAFAHAICEELRRTPEEFSEIVERVEPALLNGMGLLYLPRPEIDAMSRRMTEAKPIVESVLAQGLEGLFTGLREELDRAGEPEPGEAGADPEGGAALAGMLASVTDALKLGGLGRADDAVEAFGSAFQGAAKEGIQRDPDGYLLFGGGRWLLLPLAPRVDSHQLNQIGPAVKLARAAVAKLAPAHPGLRAGVTGRSVVHSDEVATSSGDMTLAAILSTLGVLVLFRWYFGGLRHPLCAVAALMIGLAWTFGFATLALGRMNLFATVFAAMLVGIADNFGILILTHYQDARARGASPEAAIAEAYSHCGRGAFIGGLGMVASFFSTTLTDFRGLAELGLISGAGILLCMVTMLILFPAMLVLTDRSRAVPPASARRGGGAGADPGASGPSTAKPARAPGSWWAIPLASAAIALAAGVYGFGQEFNFNILSLQATGTESVEWERLLIEQAHSSSHAISIVSDRAELDRRRAQFLGLRDLVARVETLYPEEEEAKRAALGTLRPVLAEILAAGGKEGNGSGTADDPPPVGSGCRRALAGLRQDFRSYAARDERAARVLEQPLATLSAILAQWEQDEAEVSRRLQALQDGLVGFLRAKLTALHDQCSPPPLTADSAPEFFRRRYLGEGGQIALHVYAVHDIWAWQNLNRFVDAARTVDPKITGTPVTILEASKSLYSSFQDSIVYSLIAIALILGIDFRRWLPTALTLAPLLLGLGVTLGAMRLLSFPFNFANYFSVPILVGCGVESGLHLVHSYRRGAPETTLRAVLGCSLTTILGFGTLMLAHHKGLQGLGVILTAGMTLITVATLVVLPRVLDRAVEKGWKL